MLKKYFNALALVSSLLSVNLFAETLKNSIGESINTNPKVLQKLRIYRALQQELSIAEADYYPKIDFETSAHINSSLNSLSKTDSFDTINVENEYTNYKSALTITQNLFSGFGTKRKVASKEAQILSAAYSYMGTSNEVALEMAKAYVNVLRYDELLKVALKNRQISESIFKIVANRYDSAKTSLSEVKRAESAFFLAKSNVLLALKNARDAKFVYRKILGRMPELSAMKRPNFRINVPANLQEATQYAINNNPLLFMSHYDIKSAQFLRKKANENYYPTIDLRVTQNYSDVDNINLYEQADDRLRASIVLKYNLFNGGADSAQAQKAISYMSEQVEKRRDIKRLLIENIDLAWNSYEMNKEQIVELRKYKANSEKTLRFFKQEYTVSRRSLLEFIDTQKDVINANSLYINARYDELIAKYSILDAMGLLVSTVVGDEKRFSSNVNLNIDKEAEVILDVETIELDVDKDRITDNNDLCDNSILEDNIMPYGCKKIDTFAQTKSEVDISSLKVVSKVSTNYYTSPAQVEAPVQRVIPQEQYYKKPENVIAPVRRVVPTKAVAQKTTTPAKTTSSKNEYIKKSSSYSNYPENYNQKKSSVRESYLKDDYAKSNAPRDLMMVPSSSFVKENTVSAKRIMYGDSSFDNDRKIAPAKSYEESKCVNVPSIFNVDSDGCAVSATVTISDGFQRESKPIPSELLKDIIEIASFLKKNSNTNAHIVGYSSRTSTSNYNYNLEISKQRAQRFKEELIKYGVEEYRLSIDGQGFNNPIADNNTREGRALNRRVEIKFSK